MSRRRRLTIEAMRTSTRLGVTFASILVLFAIASFVTVRAMERMDRADEAVAASDRAKHAGHRVASLVREQYIHQAHTIIEGNRSHLDHYKDIVGRTRERRARIPHPHQGAARSGRSSRRAGAKK